MKFRGTRPREKSAGTLPLETHELIEADWPWGIQWDGGAWEDYCEWQKDRATLKRINTLIRAILLDPFDGIGKPEPLKRGLSGLWSRRINDTDRLTYKALDDMIIILACKGHYE